MLIFTIVIYLFYLGMVSLRFSVPFLPSGGFGGFWWARLPHNHTETCILLVSCVWTISGGSIVFAGVCSRRCNTTTEAGRWTGLGYPATGEADSWVVAETVKAMVYGFLTVAINRGRYNSSDRLVSIWWSFHFSCNYYCASSYPTLVFFVGVGMYRLFHIFLFCK